MKIYIKIYTKKRDMTFSLAKSYIDLYIKVSRFPYIKGDNKCYEVYHSTSKENMSL